MYNVGIMHDMVGYGPLALDVIIDSYDSTNYNREARIPRRTTFPGEDGVFDMVGERGGEGKDFKAMEGVEEGKGGGKPEETVVGKESTGICPPRRKLWTGTFSRGALVDRFER